MQRVALETPVLRKNDEAAAENRRAFAASRTVAVNIMSAPGAGKTTLLEKTLPLLPFRCAVIEGDIQTNIDADRIKAIGIPAHQINTTCCHLDASMIAGAIERFPTAGVDLLIIENVGNMVCPAAYDLGETLRVMLYSVPEGAEKPRKYPRMFYQSHCVVLNKIDLAPYTDVSVDELKSNVLAVSPRASVIPVSARTGEGLDDWVAWLTGKVRELAKGTLCA